MTTLSIYTFDGGAVRTAGTSNAPLFCALDVCTALGYERPDNAYAKLDQDESELVLIEAGGGRKNAVFVTESGLYTLILGCRKPGAKAFKKWVTGEVLPSIRKTGGYGTQTQLKALSDPATLRQLLGDYAEKVMELEGEIETARPKVEVYDRIVDSGDTVGFREACKLIRAGNGAKEPEVRSFMIWARWIQRLGGRLAPASYGQERGYVTSRDREITQGGDVRVVPELRITQRGVARAVERLNREVAI